jgi:hypothetical protein
MNHFFSNHDKTKFKYLSNSLDSLMIVISEFDIYNVYYNFLACMFLHSVKMYLIDWSILFGGFFVNGCDEYSQFSVSSVQSHLVD